MDNIKIEFENWNVGVILNGRKTNCFKIMILKIKIYFVFKITLGEDKCRQTEKITNLFGYKVID